MIAGLLPCVRTFVQGRDDYRFESDVSSGIYIRLSFSLVSGWSHSWTLKTVAIDLFMISHSRTNGQLERGTGTNKFSENLIYLVTSKKRASEIGRKVVIGMAERDLNALPVSMLLKRC
jgi:hypothetical protein